MSERLAAVFLDLDDTLFDHIHSARQALASVIGGHACFQGVPFAEVEKKHAALLEKIHPLVLRGKITIDEARMRRFNALFEHYGGQVAPEALPSLGKIYREAYQSKRQAVPGSVALLTALKPHVRIVIVTNNLRKEQLGKLNDCGLAPFVDMLVTSEDVGSVKPEPGIFEFALRKADCRAEEVVMIGDSWHADVMGARQVGIEAIWFNRLGLPCPDPTMATEIRSFEPTEKLLALLGIISDK